ncbi:MAG: hypothetical protein IJS39_15175 [Synergistaceae bacterium]|nr:hypothetical protein [Synergistaceae bacterium]
MSNAAVMMKLILRLRSALLREGNRLCAASSYLCDSSEAARYQREG